MVEKELVQSFLLQLKEKTDELKKASINSLQDLQKNSILQNGVLHLLQVAIEICLDIANHFIADEGWRSPTSNRDAFQVLFEQGVLEEELLKKCQNMAGFRNILVHMYEKIDLSAVYTIVKKNLGDFDTYSRAIKNYLEQ